MGTYFSKWGNDKESCGSCGAWCMGWGPAESDLTSMERKVQAMEQRMITLELRVNTTEEANQRLHNKWNGMEDRIQQQYGDLRMMTVRCRTIEQRLDTLAFDHCEHLEDDIIVIEES